MNYFRDDDGQDLPPSTDYQDDLAQITDNGFDYRADDAGDDIDAAANLNSEGAIINQQGIIERNDDIDFFQFSSLEGAFEINVDALDVESSQGEGGSDTMGANLAVEIELYDSNGNLIDSDNPEDTLGASLSGNLNEEIYYLSVRGAGRGDPLDTGFSDYASLGQYTISGILPSGPLTVRGGDDDNIVIDGDNTPSGSDGTSLGSVWIGETNGLISNLRLVNNGSEVLQIDSIATESNVFQLATVTPITIQPGEETSFSVGFLPEEAGIVTDNLTIEYTELSSPVEDFDYNFAIQAVGSKFEGDDNYEQNDTFFEPFPLDASTPLENLAGLGIQADNDWYQINVIPGLNELEILCDFENVAADINIALYDGFGYQLALSSGSDGQQEINYLAAPEGGTYHIVVFGDNEGSEYNLRWKGLSPSVRTPAVEDAYENNDTLEQAFSLAGNQGNPLSEIDGEGTQLDNDWYRIPVDPNNRRISVDLDETSFLDGLTLDLYLGNRVTSFANGTSSSLTFDVPVGFSSLYVVVSGSNSGASYDLTYNEEPIPADPVSPDQADDAYEENDTFFEAHNLAEPEVLLSQYLGEGVQLDNDWYKVALPSGDNAIELNFPSDAENAQFVLYDSRGFQLIDPAAIVGDETFRYVDQSGDSEVVFHIAIVGDNEGTTYDFSWSSFIAAENEDVYEENDTQETAFDLSSRSGQFLSRISGFGFQADEDWYRVESDDGDEVIDLLVNTPGDRDDFVIEVFTSDGVAIPQADAAAIGDIEGTDSILFALPNSTASDYFVRITGDDAGRQYDFRWVSRIIITDDNYEPNDTFATAFDLPEENGRLSDIDGLGVQADLDYYRFDFSSNALSLNVRAEFSHDDGDIDIDLYDANFNFVRASRSITDNENVFTSLSGSNLNTIYVLVYFANAGNEYDLTWSVNRLNDSNGNRIDDDWELSSGLKAEDLDTDNNTDGDRYPLWAEFAHGLDPNQYDKPEVEIEQVDGYFHVSFLRNQKAMEAGYVIKVFESTDMRSWSAEDMTLVDQSTEGLPQDMERVTMRSSRPVSDVDQQFFRLSTIPIPEEE